MLHIIFGCVVSFTSHLDHIFLIDLILITICFCCQLGVFEMSQSGLQTVSNPSEMFLSEEHSDSEFLAGLAVAVIMDGSRAFLLEIQVFCIPFSLFQLI